MFGILSVFAWGFYISTALSALAILLVLLDHNQYKDFWPGQVPDTGTDKKRRRRMFRRIAKVTIVSAVILLPIFSVFIYTGVQPGTNSRLIFDGSLYFKRNDLSATATQVTVTAYLSNKGISDSGPVKVIIYLRDSSGISEGKTQANTGVILSHKTKELVASATLSNAITYTVDLLIFESDQKVSTARGSVNIVEKHAEATPSQPDVLKSTAAPSMGAADSTSFVTLIMIGVVVLIFIILVIARKIRSTTYTDDYRNRY
jgi:hypothetical protein